MDICLHRSFDRLEWSIQHVVLTNTYELRYFHTAITNLDPAIGIAADKVQDGDILRFGGNIDQKPMPELCNLHYAICKFVHLAGMAEIFDEVEDDEDEYVDGVPYLDMVIDLGVDIEDDEDLNASGDELADEMVEEYDNSTCRTNAFTIEEEYTVEQIQAVS